MARRSKQGQVRLFEKRQDTAAASAFSSSSIDVSSFVNVLEGELLRVNKHGFPGLVIMVVQY